jgi:hypothetical protein
LFSAVSKSKGSCRFGAQAAMIRHLVVEKISLTPDFLLSKPGAACKYSTKVFLLFYARSGENQAIPCWARDSR